MMPGVRVAFGTTLAATLVTLCLGLQVLEATGRWDRTFQDTSDEAALVTIVLCIGAAFVVARVGHGVSLTRLPARIVAVRPVALPLFAIARIRLAFDASPPVGLRI